MSPLHASPACIDAAGHEVSSTTAALTIEDVKRTVSGGPARRVRWDVLRLP
jgi:hypothetical protein